MLKSYFQELKKYKIVFFTLIALFVLSSLSIYGFKKARQLLWDAKFASALHKAQELNLNLEDKYKDLAIKDKYRVVIVANNGGEYGYAEYFKFAAEKIGWQVNIYIDSITGYEKEILKFDPDFILFFHQTTPSKNQNINMHRSKKYIVSMQSLKTMRDVYHLIDMRNPYKPKGTLESFVSTSHGVLTTEKELDIFNKMFARWNKIFNGFKIFPLVPQTDFFPAEPNNLVWISSGSWDEFRTSQRYLNFIKLLADNLSMKVYGRFNNSPYLTSKNYDGCIPSSMEIFDAIRKHGIYLLTHSKMHIETEAPTLRIFEALAANSIIIADKHPFTVKNFGDNILYFDHNADTETMYNQVKKHFDWIKQNPKKAKEMADRAHKIFIDKFTLEKDLIRIAKMHEFILKEEKALNITYPLVY